MRPEDTDKLVDILAWEVFDSNAETRDYFKNLLRESHIPSSFVFEAVALLDDNPETAARNLVDWAEGKGTNPDDTDFSILGNLLYPLFSKLGLEKRRTVIRLILRYHLLSIQILIETPEIVNSFDEELILAYAHDSLSEFPEFSTEGLFKPFLRTLIALKTLDSCIKAFLALFQTPNLQVEEHRQELAWIKNQDIKLEGRIYILFKLLLEDHLLPELPISRMANFAAHLKPLVNTSLSKEIARWLKTIHDELGYKPNLRRKKQDLDASLMIVIRKALSRGRRFHADAFLLAEDQVEEWLELEDDDNEGPYTLKNLPNRVSSFVYKAEEMLASFDKCKITIEIFLPFQCWCEQVDNWEIPLFRKSIVLGKEYRLTLRAYERVADVIGTKDIKGSALLLRHLRERWEEVHRFLKTDPDQQAIHDKFISFCREEVCNNADLNTLLSEDEGQSIGLKIMANPPIHKVTKRQREELFETALLYGLPVLIWTRCETINGVDLEEAINKLLQKECLMDFKILLERVRKERRKSPHNLKGLGQHVAILCDDPNRLPTEPLPLVG